MIVAASRAQIAPNWKKITRPRHLNQTRLTGAPDGIPRRKQNVGSPRSPWQKGGAENPIGRRWRLLPRKSNLDEISDEPSTNLPHATTTPQGNASTSKPSQRPSSSRCTSNVNPHTLKLRGDGQLQKVRKATASRQKSCPIFAVSFGTVAAARLADQVRTSAKWTSSGDPSHRA